ncbi:MULTISPECIES: Rne/Rng family ribonuclease [Arthrobacter]|uniref:Rne/Rng family ribonuclease n=2 Tax=Arthrobacter TaxID=1663 RepID=A0ABU9KFL0_9MICC|nr:Rne/Rng family ribonuclease [Arthrobacter sp. YJM1]MDP5225671.1 Rne/Rng family ribonuclease [Arthrobacter sp. YJM1]
MDTENVPAESTPAVEDAAAAPRKPARTRRRASAPVGAPAEAVVAEAAKAELSDEEKKAQRAAKAAATRAANKAKKEAEKAAAEAAASAPEEPAKAPERRPSRRRVAQAPVQTPAPVEIPAPVEAPAPEAAAVQPAKTSEAGPAAAQQPERSRKSSSSRRRRKTREAPAVEAEAVAEHAVEEAPAPAARRRRASKYKAAPVSEEAVVEAAETASVSAPAVESPAVEETPETAPAVVETEAEATAPEAPAVESPAAESPVAESPAQGSLFLTPADATSLLFHAPDLTRAFQAEDAQDEEDDEDEAEESGEGAASRSRRRRRGRSRGRAGDATEQEADDDVEGENDGVTSRRRRRRRRGEMDLELTGGLDDDPPNTVTRVRAPRTPSENVSNKVASVRGSTRLEAKKQRRRESRESGRRRQVITEAEFLARRESVDRQMVVRQKDDRIQIAVLEDGVLAEHFVSKTQQDSLIGNVYLGKVQNVLPSMEAAFVDIGRGRNAVLYAGEVNWDNANLDGAPRRIENALKSGDTVLVQVSKDPIGHKGARLTSQISLPGRYLVYVPGGSMTGISRKLPDVERNRLKKILKDRLPENAGVIVRTAAEGASEEELTNDINRLRALWESIESQTNSTKVLAPELLYGEPDLTIKVVRDVFNEDFSKLIVSGEDAWDTIEAYVTYVAPDLVGRLEKWSGEKDIFSAWRIDEQLHKALDRKVFLPSGGSLVIDRTEAMTVVDVNTGKFTGSGGNLEETVTKNNLEAAEEVVRQLRLRDIGGIIVIDFIDMVLESNRDLVLRRLVECLGRDRTKHQVAEVTSLGLVQMTRKRMGTGLLEVFGEQCEACAGRGVITYDEPLENRRPSGNLEHQHGVRPENTNQQNPRSERKRRRGRSGNTPVEEAVPAAPQPAEPETEEKAAKAAATRAVFANIAAAAHAAHVHDDELHAAQEGAERQAAVLTIGGEEVELPHGSAEAPAPAVAPAFSLDALAAAFEGLGEPAEAASAGPVTPELAAAEAPALARRSPRRSPRRSRGSRRAQSAAGASEVQQVEATAAEETGTVRRASVSQASKATGPSGEEPLVLGVGVPASEL